MRVAFLLGKATRDISLNPSIPSSASRHAKPFDINIRTNILRFIFESSTMSTDGFHASKATTFDDSKCGTVLILRPLDRSIIVPSFDPLSDPENDDRFLSSLFTFFNKPYSLIVVVDSYLIVRVDSLLRVDSCRTGSEDANISTEPLEGAT